MPAQRPAADPAWHGVDPTREERLADPFSALRHLREVAPVNQTPLGFWRLTRYADCVHLLREVPCGVRHADGSLPGRPDASGEFMLDQDPPDHTRLRKLVSKAFTPRAVESWRARARAVAEEQLAPALEAGRMEGISGLARPVPATLICEMLGVPVADRERFTTWTADATHLLAGVMAEPERLARARAGAEALDGYFSGLIAERRRAPRDDLLSVLVRAEEGGDRLTPVELRVQSAGLLIAGFETTIGLIGNAIVALARHPAEQERLRADPSLLANAVEECLRFDPPIGATLRVLHEPSCFGDRTIPRDAVVWAMLRAAQRDPEVFVEPDRFDVGRTNAKEHLAFGGGTHLCLGAHLARMEAQEAIGALLARTRHFELETDRVEWGRSLFRVPGRLPLRLSPA